MTAWFAPYAVASVVHLILLAVPVEGAAITGTKALLMPLLAVALVGGVRSAGGVTTPGWLPLALVALTFSWFGDLALDGSQGTRFLVGLALFLVAQIAYIVVFRRVGDAARTSSRLWLAGPYIAWWAGFLAYFVVSTGLDPLLVAVAAYGVALGTMAWLAHRVNTLTATGAAAFLISDSLIGLAGFADLDLPWHDVWVMSTYTLGQGLIVAGLVRHHAAHRNLAGCIP